MTNHETADQDKRKAALALNMCMVSVSQIVDYKDSNVLKQEYDAILNNLNLQHIVKDDSLLSAFRSILDIITFYLIQEGDKEIAEREYRTKLKNAIFDSFPSGGLIMGGSPATMLVGVTTMAGIGYMNYRRSKARSELEFEKKQWELQRSAIEQLHGMRRSLFETAWRLSDAYDFPDEWRLTEKQISLYNKILMDPDPHRQYDRMDVLDHVFAAFPPFWYFKSRAALENAEQYAGKGRDDLVQNFRSKALAALGNYDEAYFPLMREDVIAASAALDKFALLSKDGGDRKQMLALLDRAQKVAGSAFDVLQLCAINYTAIGEPKGAIQIFKGLVNEDYNTQLNGRMLSRIYCELEEREEYDLLVDRVGEENVLPWAKTLKEARDEQVVSARQRLVEATTAFLRKFFAARTQKLGSTMLEQLKVWDEGLGSLDSWKDKTANSAPFKSWRLMIQNELNEAYNLLKNDTGYRRHLRTDLDIWEAKIQKAADKSQVAIDALHERVEALQETETEILKVVNKSLGGLLGSPKTSTTTTYVTMGRKLNQAIAECM